MARESSGANSKWQRLSTGEGLGGLGDLQTLDLDTVEEASMISFEEPSVVEPIEYEPSEVQAQQRESKSQVKYEDPLEC